MPVDTRIFSPYMFNITNIENRQDAKLSLQRQRLI